MSGENIILEGTVVAISERAILLRIGVADRNVLHEQPEEWLPKSQIEDSDMPVEQMEKDDKVRLEIPSWIGVERGLVP